MRPKPMEFLECSSPLETTNVLLFSYVMLGPCEVKYFDFEMSHCF